MTKTTLGPWTIMNPNDSGKMKYLIGADGQGFAHTVGLMEPKDLSNARLITSAPDLLAALKKAERYIWEVACETEDGVHTLREDLPEAKLWKEIVAAISKAEGKDHD